MKLSIHQPNFLPRLKVLQKICMSDSFVYLDDVQYNRRDWQNRAIINKEKLLSISTKTHHQYTSLNQIEFFDYSYFKNKFSKITKHSYNKSQHSQWIKNYVEEILKDDYQYLADFCRNATNVILKKISYNNPIYLSSNFNINSNNASERLYKICQKLNGKVYISDSGGSNYLNEHYFLDVDIYWQDWHEPKCKLPSQQFRNLSFLDFVSQYGIEQLEQHLFHEQNFLTGKPNYNVK